MSEQYTITLGEIAAMCQRGYVVPMSSQELRMRSWHNWRKRLQGELAAAMLHWVDGLGNNYSLTLREMDHAGLPELWPEYMRRDYGIRQINQWRRARFSVGGVSANGETAVESERALEETTA